MTAQAGVGDRGWGYGVAVGDYDNDGFPDLYVTNLGSNVLYHNRGDGTFEDATSRAGVSSPAWGTSAAFFDMDADGDIDLYVARYVEFDLETIPARGSVRAISSARATAACMPFESGVSSSSAPYASSRLRRSSLMVSGMVRIRR